MMGSSPGGDLGGLGGFIGFWAVMTAAMMLPASAPVLVRVGRVWRSKATVFLVGYASVWMLAGLAGYALIEAVRGLHPGALAWPSAGRYVAGAAVAAAGLYQLTLSKRRWLERCTAARLDRFVEGGVAGVFRAGVEHGRSCVACCGALMLALYALGIMSFTWMAVITVLIVGERWLPRPVLAIRAVAAVLVTLGIAVAAAPSAVPGLTVPGGHMAAMASMSR